MTQAAERLGALAPPLYVAALGVLFLADYHLGWSVTKTWPALLILWGVMRVGRDMVRGRA